MQHHDLWDTSCQDIFRKGPIRPHLRYSVFFHGLYTIHSAPAYTEFDYLNVFTIQVSQLRVSLRTCGSMILHSQLAAKWVCAKLQVWHWINLPLEMGSPFNKVCQAFTPATEFLEARLLGNQPLFSAILVVFNLQKSFANSVLVGVPWMFVACQDDYRWIVREFLE